MVLPVVSSGALGVNPTDADVELAKRSMFDVSAASKTWDDQLVAIINRKGGAAERNPVVTEVDKLKEEDKAEISSSSLIDAAQNKVIEPVSNLIDKVGDKSEGDTKSSLSNLVDTGKNIAGSLGNSLFGQSEDKPSVEEEVTSTVEEEVTATEEKEEGSKENPILVSNVPLTKKEVKLALMHRPRDQYVEVMIDKFIIGADTVTDTVGNILDYLEGKDGDN